MDPTTENGKRKPALTAGQLVDLLAVLPRDTRVVVNAVDTSEPDDVVDEQEIVRGEWYTADWRDGNGPVTNEFYSLDCEQVPEGAGLYRRMDLRPAVVQPSAADAYDVALNALQVAAGAVKAWQEATERDDVLAPPAVRGVLVDVDSAIWTLTKLRETGRIG